MGIWKKLYRYDTQDSVTSSLSPVTLHSHCLSPIIALKLIAQTWDYHLIVPELRSPRLHNGGHDGSTLFMSWEPKEIRDTQDRRGQVRVSVRSAMPWLPVASRNGTDATASIRGKPWAHTPGASFSRKPPEEHPAIHSCLHWTLLPEESRGEGKDSFPALRNFEFSGATICILFYFIYTQF